MQTLVPDYRLIAPVLWRRGFLDRLAATNIEDGFRHMKSIRKSRCRGGLNRWTAVLFSAMASISGCGGQGDDGPSQGDSQAGLDLVRPAQIEVVSAATQAGLSFSGLVQSARRSELAFKASGRVAEMLVSEGDPVEQGQVLAENTPRLLQEHAPVAPFLKVA